MKLLACTLSVIVLAGCYTGPRFTPRFVPDAAILNQTDDSVVLPDFPGWRSSLIPGAIQLAAGETIEGVLIATVAAFGVLTTTAYAMFPASSLPQRPGISRSNGMALGLATALISVLYSSFDYGPTRHGLELNSELRSRAIAANAALLDRQIVLSDQGTPSAANVIVLDLRVGPIAPGPASETHFALVRLLKAMHPGAAVLTDASVLNPTSTTVVAVHVAATHNGFEFRIREESGYSLVIGFPSLRILNQSIVDLEIFL